MHTQHTQHTLQSSPLHAFLKSLCVPSFHNTDGHRPPKRESKSFARKPSIVSAPEAFVVLAHSHTLLGGGRRSRIFAQESHGVVVACDEPPARLEAVDSFGLLVLGLARAGSLRDRAAIRDAQDAANFEEVAL